MDERPSVVLVVVVWELVCRAFVRPALLPRTSPQRLARALLREQ